LLEHQSTDDPLMAFRLLVYMVRIWELHVRKHPGTKRLPAIVPMVVHHSREGWTSPTSFPALLDLDPDAIAAIAAYVPTFRFLLDDLRVATDASVRARAMSAVGRLALLCLRHASEPGKIVQRLARWLDLIREVRSTPDGRDALRLVWQYILTVGQPGKQEDLLEQILLLVGEEGKEDVVTAGEMLIEKGRMAERREILLKLLRTRFGALPRSAAARVRAADPTQLDRWLDRVITAPSLADLLAGG
jgi:Putative transposase, YhgA-like